jgi:signal transduction histidine kinase
MEGRGRAEAEVAAERLEPRIETELARYLVRQAPTGFAIGVLAAMVVLVVLRDVVPPPLLFTWFGLLLLLSAPAFLVVWSFRRSANVTERIGAWRRGLTAAYGLAGIGWSGAMMLFYPRVSMSYQLFLIFIVGGSGISGMAALAPVPGAFIAYLTATFVPIIALLAMSENPASRATGLLCLVFWGTTLSLAAHLRALLVRSLRLRFENLELIADLSVAKDAAEGASRAKSQLLANVSHELRTPLALILGPTRRLLAHGEGGEGVRPELETVERNAQALLKQVNDLLDVAKVEAGRVDLDRSRVDVVEVVRRTASLFEVVAKDREVVIGLQTPASVAIVADAAKLERVVLNLLSNAMKFVPDGGQVHVGVRVEHGDVEITVEDSGPGVPVALREAVFERFRRGEDAITRRHGGTGLGLAIAKDIVERHGGRIEVTDGVAGGARFRVSLPFAPEATAHVAGDAGGDRTTREALDEVARQTVAELRPRHLPGIVQGGADGRPLVLVVEDNAEMSGFLAKCLADDYRIVTAADGRQALEKALELHPDLIVTDVMMPVMGGDAFVRELRTYPGLAGVPIVVLTAKADDGLRVALLREGAQDFLTKPVVSEELCARVSNLMTLKRTRDVLQGALSSQSRDVTSLADQLAAANRAKDEFLAILSHELRTPLTPILSWAGLLRDGRLDAETVQRGLRVIERNAKLQVRIIDDLLDVSRAISGKLLLELRPTTLDPVVHAAVEALRPAAAAKGVAVETALDPSAPLVSGDPDRLQQVVWNLVSNALKFTPNGGRVVVGSERDGDQVRLVVRDSGIGIAPAALPRLFERFWQADSSPTRTFGGLGLGLAVVRHLVELHGGTVRAESDGEGKGATFVVSLPALRRGEAAAPAPAAAPSGAKLQGLKVLVVDDEQDTCDIIGAVLAEAGAEVHTSLSVGQALRDMDTWVPDILVSDIAMPGEDGYALIRKVRARPREEGGCLKAVALTAYGRTEDRVRALSAGFEMHVGKPVEPHELVRLVARLTDSAAAPA